MPKVKVERTTGLSPSEAFAKVKTFLSDDRDLKKMDPSYQCTFEDSALKGNAVGKMFKANLTVQQHAQGSHVQIEVDLPMALTLMKGMVEKTLKRKLEETLA